MTRLKVEKIMKKHIETTRFFSITINDITIDCNDYQIIERDDGKTFLITSFVEKQTGKIDINKIKKIELEF